jgi:predicted HAD superfamily Cof-like phosphohydrolase
MPQTALEVAEGMELSSQAKNALKYDKHPQDRTEAFHEIFNAPIYDGPLDEQFSHMDDQRVAFRISFIISEAFEILKKGLGIDVSLGVSSANGDPYFAFGTGNAGLCQAILNAMQDGHTRNIVEVVDGLADLNVVVNGFALELGADMKAIDQEVLASNFTKLDDEGKPIVADESNPNYPKGKILKSKNYVEPNIRSVLGLDR